MKLFLTMLCASAAWAARAAVTFTNLHSFSVSTNGGHSVAGLALGSDGNFYGTTQVGGTNGGYGTVFQISPAGALTTLYAFTNGIDGADPSSGLIQGGDGDFYGTVYHSGAYGFGGVFKVSPTGVFTPLYAFTGGNDGASPAATLVLGNDLNFYGTTYSGGSNYFGTVFKMTSSGSLTSLYSFTNGVDGEYPSGLAKGGASDNNFYGATSGGGTNGLGAVYKITPNGVFTCLYSFVGGGSGASPQAGLALAGDGNFYGTTGRSGINSGFGTIFRISANGTFSTVYTFTNGVDGSAPSAVLTLGKDGYLYGTAYTGGSIGDGTVFKISTNGAFTSLYSFTGGNDGASPDASLTQDSIGNFYSATYQGGPWGYGAIYKITTGGALTSLFVFNYQQDGSQSIGGLVQGPNGSFYGASANGGTNSFGTLFSISTNGAFTNFYSFTNGVDGANMYGGLALGSDDNFYGAAFEGGTNGWGSIVKLTSGGAFTNLYSFTNGTDGALPEAGLARGADGNLYGTTYFGGLSNVGAIFRFSPSSLLTSLYSFTNGLDGANPHARLTVGGDGNFYGTTEAGGAKGYGTIYRISPGGAFATIYAFTNGVDGGNPQAALARGPDGNYYGTTLQGGINGFGSIFRVATNGLFTNLYSFTGGNDGRAPAAGLTLGTDGNFYGTTYSLGADSFGVVFEITPGGAFTTLYSFTGRADGGNPEATLALGSDGNFYGTTYSAGAGGQGVIFRLSTGLPPVTPSALVTGLGGGAANPPYRFNILGLNNAVVTVQATTNLTTPVWVPIATNTLFGGLSSFSDPQSTNYPWRFYRLLMGW